MPDLLDAILAFFLALVVVWISTPVVKSLAWRIGAIDEPNERSLHATPTPKLGGLAILIAVEIAGLLFLPETEQTHAILIGAAVIAGVGVIDDVFTIGAGPKLLGQIIGSSIPPFNGVRLGAFTLPFVGAVDPSSVHLLTIPLLDQNVDLGHLLTIIGFVAVINVINLIDGVDGLAAGVCAISAAAFGIIAFSLQRDPAGVQNPRDPQLLADAGLGP